jgi:hypothetical protein
MTDLPPGRVHRAHLSNIGQDKYFLVVSNKRRSRLLEQVFAIRLT